MKFCVHCGDRLPGRPPFRCPGCGRVHYRNPACCAGALVVDAGRLLLVRRAIEPWRGAWDIPGGFCEPAEHPERCAVRETWEETGLRVRATGLHGIWVDPPDSAGTDAGTICVYYLAELADPHAAGSPGDEAAELGWFDPLLPPANLAFPGHLPEVLETFRTRHPAVRR